MDLLYLLHDTIRRKRFKYALTIIDIASRYKDAEPLSQKSATAVALAIQEIYRRGSLTYPRMVQVDDGKAFKGQVNQLLLKHRVVIKRGIPVNHRSQSWRRAMATRSPRGRQPEFHTDKSVVAIRYNAIQY